MYGYVHMGKDRGSGAWVYYRARWCQILPYGQGLCLSLRGFGARVHCPARWCTNTAYGQGLCLSLVVLVLCSVGARIRLMARACFSEVLVLSASCAHRCTIRPMGKDCAFLSVVWCSARVARIGVRIGPMGKDCACFSVSWCSCVQCWTSSAFRSGA